MTQRLRLAMRLHARMCARDAWIKSNGCGDSARSYFNDDPKIAKLDPATVLALLQLAMMLWQWWQQRGVKEPSVVASSDEPMDLEDDDE